jgi:ATP-dependent helicase/nuclease subunit A
MNIQQNDYDGYLALLKETAVNKIQKAADPLTESLRTGMHEKISSLLEVSYEQSSFAANSALQEEIICSLTQLAEKTANRFTELKKELPAMDFSDMERYALEILRANHGRIAKKLNHSFDEIMIDDFQDTSYPQDTILREIAEADRKIPVFRVHLYFSRIVNLQIQLLICIRCLPQLRTAGTLIKAP